VSKLRYLCLALIMVLAPACASDPEPCAAPHDADAAGAADAGAPDAPPIDAAPIDAAPIDAPLPDALELGLVLRCQCEGVAYQACVPVDDCGGSAAEGHCYSVCSGHLEYVLGCGEACTL